MMYSNVLLVLSLIVVVSIATPSFPVWPSSYSTLIQSTSSAGTSETYIYIDSTNHRYRYDVPGADGNVTELVFSPENPSVQPTIFYLITPSSCVKQFIMPPTPGPPAPPPPPPPLINCTGFIYMGTTNAHNEECDTWDMVCHAPATVITTTYLWFGQIPVRLSSSSTNSAGYMIDYYDFVPGVPAASLWTLPQQCFQKAMSKREETAHLEIEKVVALHKEAIRNLPYEA